MRKNVVSLIAILIWCCTRIVFAESPPDFPMPLMAGEEMKCSQGNNDSHSHYGGTAYAWDFNLHNVSGDSDMGLPAVSPIDGQVIYAEDYIPDDNNEPWGKCITVSCSWCDPKERTALIAHLDQIFIKQGEMVKRGQVIGLLGNADGKYLNGAHIHYQFQSGSYVSNSTKYYNIYGNPIFQSDPTSQSVVSNLVYKHGSQTSDDKVGDLSGYCYEKSVEKFISTNNQMVELRHCQNTWLNPYSGHTENHMPCRVFGSPKPQTDGRIIHWYHPTSFGPNYRSTMYFEGENTSKSGYIQEYTGQAGGAPWNGSIICDWMGGARRCYIVGWWQWETWSKLDSPVDDDSTFDPEEHEGGPNSFCGMPITDSYGLSNGQWRQDFQKCYLVHDKVYFWTRVAPGWFHDQPHWRPDMSYLFAESYERNGASVRVGVPTTDNLSGLAEIHEWWFNGNADFVWVQDVADGVNGRGIIMYDPDNFDPKNLEETHLATNQAYYLYGEVWDMFLKMGGPGGALGPVTTDRMYQNGDQQQFIQWFRDGYYENNHGSITVANYQACILATGDENYWVNNHNICSGDNGDDDPSDAQSCTPNIILENGQLFQWEDSSGYVPPYFYIAYQSQLYFLTTSPMVIAWGGAESSQVIPRCWVDSLHPVSVDDFHPASFPEGSVVHYVDMGAIFVLQNQEWHLFPEWADYVWYQNHEGVKNSWIDVTWYEMSMFAEGIPYVRPPFTCPEVPKHPNFTILKWMSDNETYTEPWYYLVYGDFLVYLTDPAMLEAWGGPEKAIPTHTCVIDKMGPISSDSLVESTFPEGTVVVHTTNGRVLVKIHNQWRYVSDPETLDYLTTFLSLSTRHIPAGDHAVHLMPEGQPLKKPSSCQLPFPLHHNQLIRKQGDDGTPWPYVYVLYHQQLVYLATDPMLASYGGLPQATLLNWCVVDQMNPVHVNNMPQASFREATVVHHVPSGGIFIRDLYRWHLFPTWDDYVWYQNNQGVSSSWIDIWDYEYSMVPVGNPWYAPETNQSTQSAVPYEETEEIYPPPPQKPPVKDLIRENLRESISWD